MKHEDKTPVPFKEDQYGFTWGPLRVRRLMSDQTETGHRVVLELQTGRQTVKLYVTPTGIMNFHYVRPENEYGKQNKQSK